MEQRHYSERMLDFGLHRNAHHANQSQCTKFINTLKPQLQRRQVSDSRSVSEKVPDGFLHTKE